MLQRIYFFLTYMEPWHILVALGLFVGMICLLWTKPGLGIYIALFFVAETFATAADLRKTVPFISFVPMFLAVPLIISMAMRKERISWGKLSWAWLVLMVCFGIRSNFSNIGINASFWAAYYLALLSMGLMLGTLIASPAYRMRVLKWLVYGGVVTMLIGLGSIFVAGRSAYTQGRLTPFHVQANIWGPTALVAFLNCLLYFQLTKGTVHRLTHIIMLSITILSVALSFSRGAIYALGIALIFYWLVGGISRWKGILVGGLISLVVIEAFIYGAARGKFETESAARLLKYTSRSRIEFETHLIRNVVRPHPLFGIGFYESALSTPMAVKRGDPHNCVLMVWLEQGTIGLLAIMILMFGNFAAIRKNTRVWPKGSEEHTISRFCMFGMIAVFLDGITCMHLWTHHAMLGVEFAILTGIISSLRGASLYQSYEYEIEYVDDVYGEPVFNNAN